MKGASKTYRTFVLRKQEKGGTGRVERFKGVPAFFTKQLFKHPMKDLEIDFTLTFKELKAWFEAYNKNLKANNPNEYRKKSLKSTHLETAKEIVRRYGAYLYQNKKTQYYIRRFWITNTGIGKEKLQHRVTIYRHLLVLEEARVITNRIFHGSNCGIEIELNPLILVAKNNANLSFALVDSQTEAKGTPEKLSQIIATKKTFDYISKPCVATCRDNDSSPFQETKNVNIHQKGVDNFFLNFEGKKQETQDRKQGSKIPFLETKENFSLTSDATATEGNPHTGAGRAKIEMYTLLTWTFCKSVLWKKQVFTPEQVEQSKKCIREYYQGISPEKLESSIAGLYDKYLQRIMLAYQYIRKSPARFIPVPWLYLDPKFRHGFAGTKEWLKVVQERRKKYKNYYGNLSLLVKLYNDYKENPCIQTFKMAEKVLQSKEDKGLMQLYYNCILDEDKFNSDFLTQKYTA